MPKKLTTQEFIEKARLVHGNKYDYSMAEYKNNKLKIKIICPMHGIFEQIPNSHLIGCGCSICASIIKINRCRSTTLTTEQFIEKANKIHNNRYNYSLVEYINNRTKVKIICPVHGTFEQTPDKHLQKHGCPLCNSSKGELFIQDYLTSHNIDFEAQKRFNDCKNKRSLPFDFYIPSLNTCIEYDGIQHYKPRDCFGGENALQDVQKRDNIKTEYCKIHNIKLIRIKFNENIQEILDNNLQCDIINNVD